MMRWGSVRKTGLGNKTSEIKEGQLGDWAWGWFELSWGKDLGRTLFSIVRVSNK